MYLWSDLIKEDATWITLLQVLWHSDTSSNICTAIQSIVFIEDKTYRPM